MKPIEVIRSADAPAPGGHYSQATVHNETIYVAGLLPIALHGPLPASAAFDVQVALVFDNLEHILKAAKSDLQHVLRTTVYVTDIEHWPRFNELYAARFGAHRPARTFVPVSTLHFGYAVELDAIAAVARETTA
jgi:2-iminobutanoate/2-iminopropanoate deaminase